MGSLLNVQTAGTAGWVSGAVALSTTSSRVPSSNGRAPCNWSGWLMSWLVGISSILGTAGPTWAQNVPKVVHFPTTQSLDPSRPQATGRSSSNPAKGAQASSPGAVQAVDAGVRPDDTSGAVAAKEPSSKDELFGLGGDAAAAKEPASKDELFGLDAGDERAREKPAMGAISWGGYAEEKIARSYDDPSHWSRILTRAQVAAKQDLGGGIAWKATGRVDYDAAYGALNFYPPAVQQDQRLNFFVEETYLDLSRGDWDLRLGRQNIIWGEVVGAFVADVVSAKDLREFILPDFDVVRIPQWAARAEYFKGDYHAELIWIPVPSYDRIGYPGADFYSFPPVPPGVNSVIEGEQKPSWSLGNTNAGARGSVLKGGWDVSVFYYRSVDAEQAFQRTSIIPGPTPTYVLQPTHFRIWQSGGTASKDLGFLTVKGEATYTNGRMFSSLDPTNPTGLVAQNTVDYALGADIPMQRDARLNLQVLQRVFTNHDPSTIFDRAETAVSALITLPSIRRVQPEVLVIQSTNRNDRLLSLKAKWSVVQNFKLIAGADIFHGPPLGLFGQFDNSDRVYVDAVYSF